MRALGTPYDGGRIMIEALTKHFREGYLRPLTTFHSSAADCRRIPIAEATCPAGLGFSAVQRVNARSKAWVELL